MIVGRGALARRDGAAVLGEAMALAESVGAVRDDWCGFSVLHTAAASVGGLEIGFSPLTGGRSAQGIARAAATGELDVVFLLGADEIEIPASGGAFVIYLGSHGDAGANRADVILPGAAWTEQAGLFVNTEGRPLAAAHAADPPGDAREDWRILRALSGRMGLPLPYDDLFALRADLYAAHPQLARIGHVTPVPWRAEPRGPLDPEPFRPAVDDYYLTNPIARASAVMAELSRRRGSQARAA